MNDGRWKWWLAVAVGCGFGAVAAFAVAPPSDSERVDLRTVVSDIFLPSVSAPAAETSPYVREERIQRGDTIAVVLSRLQVNDPEAVQMLRSAHEAKALRNLVPGRVVRAVTTPEGRINSLRYLNGAELFTLDRTDRGLTLKEVPAELETRVELRAAEIKSSLFAATDSVNLPDAVAIQLADIFSGDVDFHKDLRKGDRFSVIYETLYHEGEAVRSGRVLAAEFVNQGKTFQAVLFQHTDGQWGYYGFDGKSLRKAFLRSPLEFSRVTSGFSMRFHPVLQQWRAHKGIDYGAPTGTKVRATGDGIVDFAGKQGGYGNVIVLRHQSKFTTWYGHLSGFAKGIAKGRRVSQGETIGYVGMTGLATGPHLHYEFRINDVHQNPLRIALPEAPPIGPQQRHAFDQRVQPFAERLGWIRGQTIATLE
jgi:murein DD-endopeptidase MepM/ murein hydrolase activator NlpD